MGGNIYDVVWMSIHTTCGMNNHLYHIVGLSMLDAKDRNTCMSVTDHHEYYKFKCMLTEQDHLSDSSQQSRIGLSVGIPDAIAPH